MTNHEAIKQLRHGGNLNMFDTKDRLFIRIQLNRTEKKFVCWERWVAKQRGNWVNWNKYLSLKDVMKIRHELAEKRANQIAA